MSYLQISTSLPNWDSDTRVKLSPVQVTDEGTVDGISRDFPECRSSATLKIMGFSILEEVTSILPSREVDSVTGLFAMVSILRFGCENVAFLGSRVSFS